MFCVAYDAVAMGGYRRHPLFDLPTPDALVWRYFDLPKFLSLLDTQALYFSRADQMEDPWEGSVAAWMEESHVASLVGESAIALGHQSADVAGLQADYSRHWQKYRQRVFLSCWHMSEYESAAMWKVYAGQEGTGIAVQTTFDRLEQALPTSFPHSIYAGLVQYIDYRTEAMPLGNGFEPFLHKRLSFDYERELRVMFDTHDDDTTERGFAVGVDLAALIERVYVAPTSKPWFGELVANVFARFGCDADVIRSDLLTGPT